MQRRIRRKSQKWIYCSIIWWESGGAWRRGCARERGSVRIQRECAKATFRFSSINLQWTVYNCVAVSVSVYECVALRTTTTTTATSKTFEQSCKLLPDLKYSFWNQYLDYVAHAHHLAAVCHCWELPFLYRKGHLFIPPHLVSQPIPHPLPFHPLRICRKINNSLCAQTFNHPSCKALAMSQIYTHTLSDEGGSKGGYTPTFSRFKCALFC